MELTRENKEQLLNEIFRILASRGIKATTMDNVASALGMSKRTLYEIFPDKRGMLMEVLEYRNNKMEVVFREIFDSSPDVMTAMSRVMAKQGEEMKGIGADFFRDLDMIFVDMREIWSEKACRNDAAMRHIFERGVKEGVIRGDIDYEINVKLMQIMMESLKRMEKVFPSNLTVADAFSIITDNFLRGIATVKGIEILEKNKQCKIKTKELQ